MNVKFTFKVEVDGVIYTDYELELLSKHALTIQSHNEITTEIIKQLELHRLAVKPIGKLIPLRPGNAC